MSWYSLLLFFVRDIVGSEAEAKDIVSETFLKLWSRRQQFNSLDHIRAFLYATAKNAGIDHRRSQQRHARSHEEIRYLSEEGEEGEERIDREMIDKEVFWRIRSQVESLSPRCREVFKLMFFEEMGVAEVAMRLGIRPATVQVHRNRALKLLRNSPLGKFFER